MNNMVLIIGFILNSLLQCHTQTSQIPAGTIEENFVGGKAEYYKVFNRHLEYPKQLKRDNIDGFIFFELQIDTSGYIVDFKVIRSVDALMDKEIEKKIYLTDGKWKIMTENGRKVNYRIIDKVYFELR